MQVKELLSKGSGILLVRVFGAGLLFLMYFAFARVLGPADFGYFSLALTGVGILSTLAQWGLGTVLLKRVSINFPEHLTLVKGYILSSLLWVAALSVVLIAAGFFSADLIAIELFDKQRMTESFDYMIFAIAPAAFMSLLGQILKSVGKPVLASIAQSVAIPLFALLFGCLYWGAGDLTLSTASLSYAASGLLSTAAGAVLLMRFLGRIEKSPFVPISAAVSEGWPMLLVAAGALVLNWTDMIVLGIYSNAETVGMYSVASRTVMVTTLVLMAMNSLTVPKYAKLHAQGRTRDIQELAQRTSGVLFVLILILSGVIFAFPRNIMGMFGAEYVEGWNFLVVLAIGQVVNVSCGSVGFLLAVSGNERVFRNIMLFTACLNIPLSIVLVKYFGGIGVAYATAFSIIIWNGWALVAVRKHLGFWTFSLSRLLNRTAPD